MAAATASIAVLCGIASAATGPGLDPGFGDGGQTTVGLGGGFALAATGASGGHTFVAGNATGGATVLKLDRSGEPVHDFGNDGAASIPSLPESSGAIAKSVAIDSKGRIVLAGDVEDDFLRVRLWVARLNPDGSPDSSFSNDGYKRLDIDGDATEGGLQIRSSGRIVVGGALEVETRSRLLAVGLTQAGRLDRGFGDHGTAVVAFGHLHQVFYPSSFAHSPVLLGEGRRTLLVASDSNAVLTARLDRDGQLDTSYGRQGRGSAPARQLGIDGELQATTATATDRGGVVIGGTVFHRKPGQGIPPSDGLLLRLTPSGKPDPHFGDGKGYVTINRRFDDEVTAVAAQGSTVYAAGRTGPEGKVSPHNWFLARLSEHGVARPGGYSEPGIKGLASFDPGAAVPSLFVQKDGEPVMAGSQPVDDHNEFSGSAGYTAARFKR